MRDRRRWWGGRRVEARRRHCGGANTADRPISACLCAAGRAEMARGRLGDGPRPACGTRLGPAGMGVDAPLRRPSVRAGGLMELAVAVGRPVHASCDGMCAQWPGARPRAGRTIAARSAVRRGGGSGVAQPDTVARERSRPRREEGSAGGPRAVRSGYAGAPRVASGTRGRDDRAARSGIHGGRVPVCPVAIRLAAPVRGGLRGGCAARGQRMRRAPSTCARRAWGASSAPGGTAVMPVGMGR
jgi:hypothetical protein